MYASFLRISRALHLDVFEQPEENYFFNNPSFPTPWFPAQQMVQHLSDSAVSGFTDTSK
jgi:hypothetical protein